MKVHSHNASILDSTPNSPCRDRRERPACGRVSGIPELLYVTTTAIMHHRSAAYHNTPLFGAGTVQVQSPPGVEDTANNVNNAESEPSRWSPTAGRLGQHRVARPLHPIAHPGVPPSASRTEAVLTQRTGRGRLAASGSSNATVGQQHTSGITPPLRPAGYL
jgi:hypothetical protein